jgi:hypothetical protein
MPAQMPSRMKGARSNGAHGQTEASRRFRTGEPLQFAKNHYGSQTFAKTRNRLGDHVADFVCRKRFLWGWPFVGEIDRGTLLFAATTVFNNLYACASLTQHHQRVVDRDARIHVEKAESPRNFSRFVKAR